MSEYIFATNIFEYSNIRIYSSHSGLDLRAVRSPHGWLLFPWVLGTPHHWDHWGNKLFPPEVLPALVRTALADHRNLVIACTAMHHYITPQLQCNAIQCNENLCNFVLHCWDFLTQNNIWDQYLELIICAVLLIFLLQILPKHWINVSNQNMHRKAIFLHVINWEFNKQFPKTPRKDSFL